MSVVVDNERIKLAASAFDRLSTSLATVGFVGPFVSLVYGAGQTVLAPQFSVIAAICWLIAALSLHLIAQQLLGALRDDRT